MPILVILWIINIRINEELQISFSLDVRLGTM